MVPRIRWLTVTATLAVALGLVVAACGGGAEPTSTPRPTAAPTATTAPPTATSPVGPAPTATTAAPTATAAVQPTATPPPTFAPPTPTAAPKPVRGGTIILSNGAELQTKDPTKIYAYTHFYYMGAVFSNIIGFQNKRWSDTDITGDLADSWSISADGKSITFKINPNARWQNLPPLNGRPVTAADIKFTHDLIADPAYGSAYRSRYPANIERVEAPDAKTVVFRLSRPTAPFLLQLANNIIKIVAPEIYAKDGTFENTVVGSGAFVFDRSEPGVRTVVKANPNYWKQGLDGKPLPYIDGITTLIIPDPTAQLAALKTGKTAFISVGFLTFDEFEDVQKSARGIAISRDFKLFIQLLRINTEKKPFDDVRVRQALLKAIDQESHLKFVLREPDAPLNGIVAAGIQGFELPQSELKQLLKYDLAESKKLLAAAGFPNGFEVELSAQYGAPAGAVAEATWATLAQGLTDAGFKVKAYYPPGAAAGIAYLYGGKYTLNLGSLPYDGIAWNYLRTSWHSQGSTNAMGIKDPVLDKAIEDAESELDVARQHQRVQDIQRYIIGQAYSVPMINGWLYAAQWNWVKNYNRVWPWGHPGIENAWLER